MLPPAALSPVLARYTVEVWKLLTCCSVAGFEETNAYFIILCLGLQCQHHCSCGTPWGGGVGP